MEGDIVLITLYFFFPDAGGVSVMDGCDRFVLRLVGLKAGSSTSSDGRGDRMETVFFLLGSSDERLCCDTGGNGTAEVVGGCFAVREVLDRSMVVVVIMRFDLSITKKLDATNSALREGSSSC